MGATRDMWKNQDKTGAGEKSVALDSAHHNMVCALRLFNSQFGGSESVFTSSGLDGKVVFWSQAELNDAMASLR